MNRPEISIIVPVYKIEEALLRRCIESLRDQTMETIEILLVDDGCPENGGAICHEYAAADERIRVIHRSNGGISAARNDGIAAAKGKYLSFVDGDDFVEPDYCRVLYTAAEESGADITACGVDRFHPNTGTFTPFTSVQNRVFRETAEIRQLTLSLLRTIRLRQNEVHLPINHYVWAHLYRAESIRGVFFDSHLARGEDKIFNLMALDHCRVFCNVPEVLYHYVVNQNSISRRFKADAIPQALMTYRLYRSLPMVEQDNDYRNAHYIRTCCMAIGQVPHFFHPDNPDKAPVAAFRRFCREDVVAEAIEKADIRDMRPCKMKLCILCLKAGLYGPAAKLARRFGL